jgi:hypothetical protein
VTRFALTGKTDEDAVHWNREFLALRETILRMNHKPRRLAVTDGDPLTTYDPIPSRPGLRVPPWTFL